MPAMQPPFAHALILALLLCTLGPVAARAAEDKARATALAPDTSAKAHASLEALIKAEKYAEAEKLAQALVEAHTKEEGAEARLTLLTRLVLVDTQHALGKNAEVVAQCRQWLPAAARVFGPADHTTLELRSLLARCLEAGGPFGRGLAGVPRFDPPGEAGAGRRGQANPQQPVPLPPDLVQPGQIQGGRAAAAPLDFRPDTGVRGR